jgi:hypothetical protein
VGLAPIHRTRRAEICLGFPHRNLGKSAQTEV